MSLVPYLLPLFLTLLVVTGAQLDPKKVILSDSRGETNQGNLRESKRSQELDKGILWEEGVSMWERRMKEKERLERRMKANMEMWEGRMKSKKERLERRKIERCLLQGEKIGSKI